MAPILGALTVVACSAETPASTSPAEKVVIQVTAASPLQTSGELGGQADATPRVRVTNQTGRPLPNIWVTFAVTKGGGEIQKSRSLTDPSGYADVGRWMLGGFGAENAVTASIDGVVRLTFTATVVVPPLDAALAKVRLVFARSVADRWHLYTINGDGSELRPLTDGPFDDTDPAVSPDGSTIAFTRNGGIYLMAADGTGIRSLIPALASHPAWSADGTQIAFADSGRALAILNLTTGRVRRLTDGKDAGDSHPSWSADGRQLAFTHVEDLGGDYFTRVAVIDVDGNGLSVLGRQEPFMGTIRSWASWSPVWTNNNHIVFAGPNNGLEPTVFEMARDGSAVVEIARPPLGGFISTMDDISPKGDWITMTILKGPTGDLDVVLVSATGAAFRVTMNGRSSSARFLRGPTATAAVPSDQLGVFSVMQGVTVPTYMVFRPFTSLAELDSDSLNDANLMAQTTADDRAKIDKLYESSLLSREQAIYIVSPKQSYIPVSFADSDPFWKTNPVVMAAAAKKGSVTQGGAPKAEKKP